ncbi:MAG: hypothetical protein B6D68_03395 [spirochete symbiont of Stewartia floridana]|nr:MAG: hypothetical protein B6D68_03395 [spirochete symbiont of Stewartia floridana]
MKRIYALAVILIYVTTLVFAEYPPKGWTDDIIEGAERARQEDKMLLLNFSGTDWCIWCKKLEANIFSDPEYGEWANDNLVQVLLDFPSSIEQSERVVRQNQALQQFFGIRGYPTIMVLDSNLIPLLQTGYLDVDAKGYIQHLQDDRNINLTSPERFKTEFDKVIRDISLY